MSQYYVGIDLHTRSIQICVIDAEGSVVLERRSSNCLAEVLEILSPFGLQLQIAVESTYNWYWLVDGLMDAGYDVQLAHAYGLRLIIGAKVKTDKRDAYCLARYLRLGELPTAFVYPKDKRPLRDLLRRRTNFVQFRTAVYTSLRIQFRQYNRDTFKTDELKTLSPDVIDEIDIPEATRLSARMMVEQANLFSRQINDLEKTIKASIKDKPEFDLLKSIPGIHDILGMTIYYEVGDIQRFHSDRNFSSYCRLTPPIANSDGKNYKASGRKQGNPYLKWAFCVAATQAGIAYDKCRKFKQKHARRRTGNIGKLKANNILAHKLALAAFYTLRDQVPFDWSRMFNN